jgi:hypothetical protein
MPVKRSVQRNSGAYVRLTFAVAVRQSVDYVPERLTAAKKGLTILSVDDGLRSSRSREYADRKQFIGLSAGHRGG